MDRTIHKNGLMKKELLLLLPFMKEPWKEFTLSEIKRLTKKKSHHYVFEALKRFTSMDILEEKRIGNTNIYVLKESYYLSFLEQLIREQRTDIPYENIRQIRIRSPFHILLIGGSFAEKKQKPGSDIDIAIIIPDSESKRPYQAALKQGELIKPEVHGYVFTKSEFYQMLVNKEFNYGKELARKHIIYEGAEIYYNILFEAMRNGFKG